MGEQFAPPGVADVSGAFGAEEIDDPGRSRIILHRPGERIVDDHQESLPDPSPRRAPASQTCQLSRPKTQWDRLAGSTKPRGVVMYAVVLNVTVNDQEAARGGLREQVVPQVSGSPGFVAGY